MTRRIQLLCVIAFLFTFASSSVCRAWENEIPSNLKGICIYAPDPDYPPAIYHRGIAGKGIFRININPKTGLVSEVKILRSTGYQILNELAAKAFLQWRFKPGTIDHYDVSYEFHLLGGARQLH